jgi:hypothetical protein
VIRPATIEPGLPANHRGAAMGQAAPPSDFAYVAQADIIDIS